MKKTILNSHKISELETIPRDNKIVKKISQAFTKEKVNKIILKNINNDEKNEIMYQSKKK